MRAHRGGVLAVLLGLAVAACAQHRAADAPVQPGTNAAAVAPVGEDAGSRFIGVIGTKARHAPPFLGVPETNFYCLRSFVDRQTGEARHQLYVADSYSGAERHWDAAHDGAGHALRFIEISRYEITCDGGCAYAEEFAADIPERELRANLQGLKVVFTAGSGAEKTIAISGSQITAQFAAIDGQQNLAQPPAPPHQ